MIYIENGVIHLTRGDDAAFLVPLKTPDGGEYALTGSEYLIFGVQERPAEDAAVVLEVNSAPGENLIVLAHGDTEDLPVGFYSAELQLMLEGGRRVTVWPRLTGSGRTSRSNRRNFCLMTEVIQR